MQWYTYMQAEMFNGRAAMIGFAAILVSAF